MLEAGLTDRHLDQSAISCPVNGERSLIQSIIAATGAIREGMGHSVGGEVLQAI